MNRNQIKNITILFLILATSIVFGLSYGSSNHNTYLIHGLTQINHDFLSGDWFAHGTQHYHEKFSNILLFVNYINLPLDLTLTAIDVFLRIIALIAVYKIIYLISDKYAFISFTIVLVLVVVEKTTSVAGSYIFASMLQPSSFGSAFSIIGLLFFLRGKFFITGLSIALAGYMHTNFLLLGFVYLGIAHLFLGTKGIIKRSVIQFFPMLIILALELPFLLSMLTAENGKMGTYIFQFIRSPHHYVPSHFLYDFLLFIGWSIVGGTSLLLINIEDNLKKRLVGLYSALLIIIAISTLLTTIVFIPTVSKLFFWRMAPFSVLLSQILLVTAAVNQAFLDKKGPTVNLLIIGLLLLLGYLFIFRWYLYQYDLTSGKTLLVTGVMSVCSVLFLRNFIILKIKPIVLDISVIAAACFGMLLLTLIYQYNDTFYRSSNLLNGFPGKAQTELYQWVRKTKKLDTFLIPPNMENFRLHGERAVVVDWKSTPIDPSGLIEWYKRIQDITALEDIKSHKDAMNAYYLMNKDRLTYLKKKYGINYAVLYRDKNNLNFKLNEVFKNEKFIVMSLDGL